MSTAYAFSSRWRLPAAPERCWAELEGVLAGEPVPWWPALTVASDAPTLHVGDVVRLSVRSPLHYRLTVELTVTAVTPRREVAATSAGDLAGCGSVVLDAVDGATELTWTWEVTTVRPWMQRTDWLLRPVFTAAHHRVMRRGEQGLRRRLAAT